MYAEVYQQVRNYYQRTTAISATKVPTIVAVSKHHSRADIQQAWEAGARHFGENYVQEAITKIVASPPHCQWHMIGQVQSNKSALVARYFDWVQTIDRLKIAQRLSVQRPLAMNPLQVCIQVNIDRDPNKSGCNEHDCMALAKQIASLPNITLRGIMVIPNQQSQQAFHKTSALFAAMQACLPMCQIDTLSMGMSGDWQQALDAGSTMVRIGTAIFGQRTPSR